MTDFKVINTEGMGAGEYIERFGHYEYLNHLRMQAAIDALDKSMMEFFNNQTEDGNND